MNNSLWMVHRFLRSLGNLDKPVKLCRSLKRQLYKLTLIDLRTCEFHKSRTYNMKGIILMHPHLRKFLT